MHRDRCIKAVADLRASIAYDMTAAMSLTAQAARVGRLPGGPLRAASLVSARRAITVALRHGWLNAATVNHCIADGLAGCGCRVTNGINDVAGFSDRCGWRERRIVATCDTERCKQQNESCECKFHVIFSPNAVR